MRFRVRWYSYATAIFLGIASAFLMSSLLRAEGNTLLKGLSISLAVWAVLGVPLGVTWPGKGWRWGLWLASPLWVLVMLGFLFAGGLHLLLVKDLPILIGVTVAACVGAWIGARFVRHREGA